MILIGGRDAVNIEGLRHIERSHKKRLLFRYADGQELFFQGAWVERIDFRSLLQEINFHGSDVGVKEETQQPQDAGMKIGSAPTP